MSRRISGSIFWGLVFVVAGVLILGHNLGYPIPISIGTVRYWPALLIAWGLFKLLDFFRSKTEGTKTPLFSGGDIAAIVIVILLGSLITLAANMSPDRAKFFQAGVLDVWDLTGNSFEFNEQHFMDTSGNPTIEITNRFGDVEVMPADIDRITVDVRKSIHAANQAEAERLSAGFSYSISSEGSKYLVSASQDRRFKTSIVVHVPLHSSVAVDNRNGAVRVRGLTGSQEITNRFGDIEVRGITGTVQVQNQNGEVQVNDVSDSVAIANTFAPITVKNIRGALKITGRNNPLNVDHVEKDLDVDSSYQNVDIRDAGGAVNVRNRNGEISIHLLQPPTKDISVSSEYGNVNMDLPSASSFNADVRNRYGNVYSEFKELRGMSEDSNRLMNGQVGSGGPVIRIDSRNGEIRLRKRG